MPKKKSKPYHHGQLRALLVELALATLETGPPEDVSLRALAQQAEVSSMAVYRHFADKEALLNAVAAVGFEDLGERMILVNHASNAKAALAALGVVYVTFALERPGLFRLMYGGKPPATEVPPDRAPHAGYAALAQRVAELAKPEDRDAAFLASWSLVHGLATLLVTGRVRQPIQDPIAMAERVCRFFVAAFDGGVEAGSR